MSHPDEICIFAPVFWRGFPFKTFYNSEHWRKKRSQFDLKSRVTGGSEIRPGIPSNWRIFESNCLSISSQFDSNVFQVLGIPGRTLVQLVTQLYRSKWLHYFLQWNYRADLTHYLKRACKNDVTPTKVGWIISGILVISINPLLPSVAFMRRSDKILILI